MYYGRDVEEASEFIVFLELALVIVFFLYPMFSPPIEGFFYFFVSLMLVLPLYGGFRAARNFHLPIWKASLVGPLAFTISFVLFPMIFSLTSSLVGGNGSIFSFDSEFSVIAGVLFVVSLILSLIGAVIGKKFKASRKN